MRAASVLIMHTPLAHRIGLPSTQQVPFRSFQPGLFDLQSHTSTEKDKPVDLESQLIHGKLKDDGRF